MYCLYLFMIIYREDDIKKMFFKNVNVTSHRPPACGRSSGLYIGMIDCKFGF